MVFLVSTCILLLADTLPNEYMCISYIHAGFNLQTLHSTFLCHSGLYGIV